jgi:TonB family protein
MERVSMESRQGWVVSVMLHAALITALFYMHVRTQVPAPEFVEMSMGGFAGGGGGGGAMAVSPRALEASARGSAGQAEEDNVSLPQRRASAFPEDAINLPSSKKSVNPEALPNFSTADKIAGDERKYVPGGSGSVNKEMTAGMPGRGSGKGSGGGTGNGIGTGSGDGIGDGTGNGLGYGIQWSGGGTRRVEHGALPVYPAGVNTEAQIKLKLIVMPNGTVKSAQPLQKGDTRLENAALKVVRLWKFDPLQSAQPAIDQTCVVTFNFRLK